MAASEQAAERERLAAIEQAAEQERLAAAKVETFRINGLMEAASEQAVGTKMGTQVWGAPLQETDFLGTLAVV